jgi:hypothetical protein
MSISGIAAVVRSPTALEFLRGYPAEQLVTNRQFMVRLAATTPAEPTGADRFPAPAAVGVDQARPARSGPFWGWWHVSQWLT